MRKIRFIHGLNFFDSVMLGVGFIIGSGIFIMPLIAAESTGTYSILAWIFGGFYQILTGLCFAECAIKLPKAGGLYAYSHKAFGDTIGFFAGWTFWIGYLITIAAEQWALGWYLQFFLPQVALIIRVTIGVLTGFVLTYINYRGVKPGGKVGDWLTIGKLIAVFIFIIIALFYFKLINFYPLLPSNITSNTALIPALGSATVLVLYAYLGEEIITVPEEEIKDAKKTVPKAVIIAAVSTMAIYLLVVFAFLGADRWTNYISSQSPLSALIAAVTGSQVVGIILTVGGLISIIGSLNAVILGTARISFSMSRDELFPKIFGKLHPVHGTPYMSLIIQTLIALVLSYAVPDFVVLASLAIMFTVIPYALSSFATIKLVGKAKGKLDVLHSNITPIIAGLLSIALLGTFWNQPMILELGAAVLFAGLLIFIERKKIKKL